MDKTTKTFVIAGSSIAILSGLTILSLLVIFFLVPFAKKIDSGAKDSNSDQSIPIGKPSEQSSDQIDEIITEIIESDTLDQVDAGIRGLNTPYIEGLPMLCAYRNKGMENWQATGSNGVKPRAITAWIQLNPEQFNRHVKIFLSRTNYLLDPGDNDWSHDMGQNGFEYSRGNLVIGCMNTSAIYNGYESFGYPNTRGTKDP